MSRNPATLALALALGTAVVATQVGSPGWFVGAALAVTMVLILLRDTTSNLAGYLFALPLQIGQSFAMFRLGASDLFMIPVAARSGFDAWRRQEGLPACTLTRPFGLMVVAFTVAAIVGVIETGGFTSYALLNRSGGILFLMAGFLAMARVIESPRRAMWAVRWFILGVAISNALALVAVVAGMAGLESGVYVFGNLRLYGWVGNPSLYGGILMTAVMIELGLLASPDPLWGYRRLRWINIGLMGLALVLTVSRSAWLSVAVAAGSLFVALVFERSPRGDRRLAHKAIVGLWAVAPTVVLGWIFAVNLSAGMESLQDRISILRGSAARQAAERTVAPVLTSPETQQTDAPQATGKPTVVPPVAAPPRHRFFGSLATAFSPTGPVMNASGLLDRTAIHEAAWSDYTRSPRTMALGIGLGTFYATSAAHFGFPLIIHNTFEWFLIELGPLGLVALLWTWGRTGWNLRIACRVSDGRRELALGLAGAFAGMTAFLMLNEGLYQRHFWLVMLLADRVATFPQWERGADAPDVVEAQDAMDQFVGAGSSGRGPCRS